MICPRCKKQLPAGALSCPYCNVKFLTVSQSATKTAPAPTQPLSSGFTRYEDSGLAFSGLYRVFYKIYRVIPLILFCLGTISLLLIGIILAIDDTDPIWLLLSLFSPVISFIGSSFIALMLSPKIARTDATLEILKKL